MRPAAHDNLRLRWLRHVLGTASISDAVRVVLLALAEGMDEDGRVEADREELAQLLSRSPRRISSRLSAAIEAGLLKRTRRGSRGAKSAFEAGLPESALVTPGGPMFPRKQRTEPRPVSEETNRPRGSPVSDETDHPRGSRGAVPSSPPGVTKESPPIGEERSEPAPDTPPAPPDHRSRHGRVKALSAVYEDATNHMTNPDKVRGIVRKAVDAGCYSDEEIIRGLRHIAAEGRFSLTADSLRIAINKSAPRPNLRVVGGHTPYRNPSDYGDNPDPWA